MKTVYTLSLYSSHRSGLARTGETVCFVPAVRPGDQVLFEGKVNWTLRKNLTEIIGHGELDLAEHGAHVAYCASEPCYILCEMTFQPPPDAENPQLQKQSAGVLFDPEKIAPALPIPADFDSFWATRLAALAAVPLNLRRVPRSAPGAFRVEELTADGFNADPMHGELTVPASGANGKYPAILFPHGAGVRSAGVRPGVVWAARGVLTLDFNAHGLPNGEPPQWYATVGAEKLGNYPLWGFDSGDPDAVYMLRVFLRVRRALDAVAALPEWDGKNLILYGGSQGAWQSFAGACLDPRVSAVASWIPAGADMFNGGWPMLEAMPRTSPKRECYRKTIPYFDNVSFASRVRVPVLMAQGLIDGVCKADGVTALYNQCPSTDKTRILYYQMGHETPECVLTALDEFVLGHLK